MPFRSHLVTASKAVARYEALALKPRSSSAWTHLAHRLNAASSYARYYQKPVLADALMALARDCQHRALSELLR